MIRQMIPISGAMAASQRMSPMMMRARAMAWVLPAAVLVACGTPPQHQLSPRLERAAHHAAVSLCRAFGYADADRVTVCTPYLR